MFWVLNLVEKLFPYIFLKLGPLFKSKKIIRKNLNICSQNISNIDEKKIIDGMWKNYGMTFIEYIFLDKLKRDGTRILQLRVKRILKI